LGSFLFNEKVVRLCADHFLFTNYQLLTLGSVKN
jgi:hypothetical protein